MTKKDSKSNWNGYTKVKIKLNKNIKIKKKKKRTEKRIKVNKWCNQGSTKNDETKLKFVVYTKQHKSHLILNV